MGRGVGWRGRGRRGSSWEGETGTHFSMKLVSSFKAPLHMFLCFCLAEGRLSAPPSAPGPFLPSWSPPPLNVPIRHRRACVLLLMHTRRRSALLCASARTTAMASGWFGGHHSDKIRGPAILRPEGTPEPPRRCSPVASARVRMRTTCPNSVVQSAGV